MEEVTAGLQPEAPEDDKLLVARLVKRIKEDKAHHQDAFKQMRENRFVATRGCDPNWGRDKYRANITGRHIKRKTAALYAKNPRIVAKSPDYMFFTVWDETAASLRQAMTIVGLAVEQPLSLPHEAVLEAQAVIQDFKTGMEAKARLKKIAKTLEKLFKRSMQEQKPLDFKTALKAAVRRALTTGVAYCKLDIQREVGPSAEGSSLLADSRDRIAKLEDLAKRAAADEIDQINGELAELQHAASTLAQQHEIVLQEGLVFDFPESHKVIPDKKTKSIVGFVGSDHLTVEYDYSVAKVREKFGVDVSKVMSYSVSDSVPTVPSDVGRVRKDHELVQVWEHFDRTTGMCYFLVEGHPGFLKPPAAPNVFVDDFWPVYALTFSAGELEEGKLFPPSDVELMLHMQREHNRARQGARDHRKAAQPRWAHANGSMSEDDAKAVAKASPFSNTKINMQPGTKLQDVLQTIPVPGVDPNLYETGPTWEDTQVVVGAGEARFGGMSKATATEAAISEGSTTSVDSADIDDLDGFLTAIARGGGQILLRESTPEYVLRKCGPGAVWPDATLDETAEHIFLEVAAGSTGRPNQAVEVANWSKMLPYMLQMKGIDPEWLVKETITRLDDKLDYTEALDVDSISMAAQNMVDGKAATGGADQPAGEGKTNKQGKEPSNQARNGADNTPRPPGQSGSSPAMGSNQVQ